MLSRRHSLSGCFATPAYSFTQRVDCVITSSALIPTWRNRPASDEMCERGCANNMPFGLLFFPPSFLVVAGGSGKWLCLLTEMLERAHASVAINSKLTQWTWWFFKSLIYWLSSLRTYSYSLWQHRGSVAQRRGRTHGCIAGSCNGFCSRCNTPVDLITEQDFVLLMVMTRTMIINIMVLL